MITAKEIRIFGVLLIAAFSYHFLAEVPDYLRKGDWTGLTLNMLSYSLFGGIAALYLIRFAKQLIWCRKGHAWVDHPAVYSKKNPEKLRWRAYTNCAHCFQDKESFDHEEARKKGVCPNCSTRIPWR